MVLETSQQLEVAEFLPTMHSPPLQACPVQQVALIGGEHALWINVGTVCQT